MDQLFVFPINNSVLFKKVTLPYHVFENRYRRMIKDAMDTNRLVAIVPYQDHGQYHDEVCVAGYPQILNQYDDGQMDIYITGAVKCRLRNKIIDSPYKIYTFEELNESVFVNEETQDDLDMLRSLIENWAIKYLEDEEQREHFGRILYDPELLVNYSAVFLIDDMQIKQEVMRAGNIKKKINIILRSLGPKEISLGPFMPSLRF